MKVFLLPLAGLAIIASVTSCSQNNAGGYGSDAEIANAVADGTMPPWMAEYADSSYETGNYTSANDYSYNPPAKPSTSKASSTTSKKKTTKKTTTRRPSTITYTVKKGDTLGAIARRNGTSVKAIKSTNGLKSDLIRIGQKLRIPRK